MTFRGKTRVGTLARFAATAASVLVLALFGAGYAAHIDKPYPTYQENQP